jgi:hypothetical protein
MEFNERWEAVWTVDSETGEQVLRDLKTGKVIAKRDKNGEIIYAI